MFKKFVLAVAIMFVLNIIVTGLLQSRIKIIGNEINSIESTYSAEHTKHSFLIRERQELIRRERIVSYAQQHLGMRLLTPDEFASGHFIKEIVEDPARNNSIIYTFIDFLAPNISATETRR